jgi:acyl-coenzyme A thioesterase PaaI-like protein
MKANTLRRIVNLWPPFLFTGIRITRLTEDFREGEVVLKHHWYNRNYVGTHFGGSLFAMTDPMYMIMLMQNMGHEYYVWDRRATIDFLKPARGTVTASFKLDDATLADIRAKTASGEKYFPEFTVKISDASGEVVASVLRTVYVRKKPPKQ